MSHYTLQGTLPALSLASEVEAESDGLRPGVAEGANAAAPAPSPGETEARRAREAILPTVIFGLVTICIGADLVDDVVRDSGPAHLAGMFVGTLLSLAGLVLMLRLLKHSRAQVRELESALDHTRADCRRFREQAGQMLHGIGALIDEQFAQWELSPSEREVALLLLKGLSLKSIAEARRSSEPTVRQQAQAIYRKSRLTGRAELAAFFLEDLLLPQDLIPRPTPAPSATAKTARA